MPGMPEHHTRGLPELVDALDADLDVGLTSAHAAEQLEALGPNSLTEAPERPAWLHFVDQFRNLLVVMLVVGALLAGIFGDLKDAVAIALVLLLNAVLGFVQERRAAHGLAALRDLLALQARVRRDGRVHQVDAADLVPGDVIMVEAGDRIPADGRVVEAHAFEVDESALTGESVPVAKDASPQADAMATPLAERTSSVFLHTQVTRGRAVVLVAATGDDTEIGKIAALVAAEPDEQTPLQRQLDRLGKVLASVSAVVVVAYLGLGIADGRSVTDTFVSAVALLVAAIPEGLPAVVTLTLALGTSRLAAGGAIVKRLRSVETLGSASVICSDKTGTLTLNEMTVERVVVLGAEASVSGSGYHVDGDVAPGIDPEALESLALVAALCNDSQVRAGELVGDPTEGALVVFAAKVGVDASQAREAHPRLDEVPFDSDNRLMITAHPAESAGADGPVRVAVKGAFEEVASRCTTVRTGDGSLVALDGDGVASLADAATGLAEHGMRVLACADRIDPELVDLGAASFDLSGLRFVGLVGMVDPPRREAATRSPRAVRQGST